MGDARTCASCGADVAVDAPGGVCPRCALAAALPVASADPTPEEVAAKLPAFDILGVLGRGGMGVVFKARQKALDRVVALKVLPPATAKAPGFAERFVREAKAMARLQHPNIVAVHDFGTTDGVSWLSMEFVDGMNIREAMAAGRVTPKEALAIVPQICDALQYAHDRGVVHRDIKPENVMIDRDGRVRIADFGLAKLADRDAGDPSLTAAGQVMGTLRYMAPEQWERPKDVDHRADIYSMGVVFYEMLTGELPMGKFEPPSGRAKVDVRIDDVVMRAIERDRERRWQRADEVKTQVSAITSGGVGAPANPAASKTEKRVPQPRHVVEEAREQRAADADDAEVKKERIRAPVLAGYLLAALFATAGGAFSAAGNSRGSKWFLNADLAILFGLFAVIVLTGVAWRSGALFGLRARIRWRLRPRSLRWLPLGTFAVLATAYVALAIVLVRGSDDGPFGVACRGAYMALGVVGVVMCTYRREAVRDAEAGKRESAGSPLAIELVAGVLFVTAATGVGDKDFVDTWIRPVAWAFDAEPVPGERQHGSVDESYRRLVWETWASAQRLQGGDWDPSLAALYDDESSAALAAMGADRRSSEGAAGALGVPLLSRRVAALVNFELTRARFGGWDGTGFTTAVVDVSDGMKTLRFAMRQDAHTIDRSMWRFTSAPVEMR